MTGRNIRRPARDKEICSLRDQGLTLQAIADKMGVTRERVRQIVKVRGGPTARQLRDRRQTAAERQVEVLRRLIAIDLAVNPGATADDVAERLVVPVAVVKRAMTLEMRARLLSPARKSHLSRWSDQEILATLQKAAEYYYPLTVEAYTDLLNVGEIIGPSAASIYKRFKTWRSACDAANVECGESRTASYESKWTDADLIGFVCVYLRQSGSRGSLGDYERWREFYGEDAPSSGTLRVRLGGWRAVKAAALRAMQTTK
jgi:hypothetical protein